MTHLLFVVGPTACGKSELAVCISEKLRDAGGIQPELINCDSVQFFAGVEIGAAKPEPELLARAPHHLLGHVGLGDAYTAGDFCREALSLIEHREKEGCTRFLPVGGSGFYVQALEKGMFEVPEIRAGVREELEEKLRREGLGSLYEELSSRDPEAASQIKPQDSYRLLRALEILRSEPTGATLTEIKHRFEVKRPPRPFRVSKIGVFRPRDVLREKVTLRTQSMLERGLIDEVRGLRAQGLGAWAPLQSVGYKEVQEHLDGRLPFSELEATIVTKTMQLAKRQMTWFKRDPSILWFDSEQGWEKPLQSAMHLFET